MVNVQYKTKLKTCALNDLTDSVKNKKLFTCKMHKNIQSMMERVSSKLYPKKGIYDDNPIVCFVDVYRLKNGIGKSVNRFH